jgi:DNA (cytosine-5)-methyltransferase 1
MTAYYNEHEPFAAEWLRELIKAGHIAPGDVDERSIEDVTPDDLRPYDQCHFFAGIGGWSYALRLAGWPDKRPVWTGSCPCQPFSSAGKGGGFGDERHLWPAFFWLIQQSHPDTIFGEQVASKDGLGWLDLVQSDLEGENYAVSAFDLCAASVGAPHIRQRLLWVANANDSERRADHVPGVDNFREEKEWDEGANQPGRLSKSSLGDANSQRRKEQRQPVTDQSKQLGPELPGFWAGSEWVHCLDGKARPTKPGLCPLAHGIPNRVGTLRGAGNAIVPQVAAELITAFLKTTR